MRKSGYVPFPDPQSHRILLARLSDADVRETLRLAWTDPQALDPARRTARVTRLIAQNLGLLATSLERACHSAEAVATFLMRALFTMSAGERGEHNADDRDHEVAADDVDAASAAKLHSTGSTRP